MKLNNFKGNPNKKIKFKIAKNVKVKGNKNYINGRLEHKKRIKNDSWLHFVRVNQKFKLDSSIPFYVSTFCWHI